MLIWSQFILSLLLLATIKSSSTPKSTDEPQKKEAALSLGAVKVRGGVHDVLIVRERLVGRIAGTPIFAVEGVRLQYLGTTNPKMYSSEEVSMQNAVASFLSSAGFHYSKCTKGSECYDLSRTLACNFNLSCPSQDLSDYFLGNAEMLRVYAANGGAGSTVRVIRGLVKMSCFNPYNEGKLVCAAFVARTSSARTGPRLLSRGADTEGNASNTVEVETLLALKHKISSYLQVRGSIPFMWTQHPSWTTYNAPVEIFDTHKNAAMQDVSNQQVFDSHVGIMKKIYANMRVRFVSLIEEGPDNEGEYNLAATYKKMVDGSSEKGAFDYLPFSLTSEVSKKKKGPWIEALMGKLRPLNWTHLCADTREGEHQKDIVRVSCLSSLDRSSVVQRQISDSATRSMLMHLLYPERSDTAGTDLPLDMKEWMARSWVEIANCIAAQYAGTDAKKNDLILTGKGTLMGRIRDTTWMTAQRHINANYYDKEKLKTMRIIFGDSAVKAK
jgi:hypothetical protein